MDEIKAFVAAIPAGKTGRGFNQLTFQLMQDFDYNEINTKPIRASELHALICVALNTRLNIPLEKCQTLDKTAMGSTLAMYIGPFGC